MLLLSLNAYVLLVNPWTHFVSCKWFLCNVNLYTVIVARHQRIHWKWRVSLKLRKNKTHFQIYQPHWHAKTKIQETYDTKITYCFNVLLYKKKKRGKNPMHNTCITYYIWRKCMNFIQFVVCSRKPKIDVIYKK